ncbi:uncharacterized protein LOC135350948 isoform X5 [Halichondria panicea]|uniref:uncharacterized protein LOC135350948 isoform X5 n=1 Tax=Halichondria panicea TaxID=6063 RepID=UPI00312B2AD5
MYLIVLSWALLALDVAIQANGQCTENDVRLVGASLPNEGRVEICINNAWGTICDDRWDANEATVVCRQLGYLSTDSLALGSAHFGRGTGIIVLDDVGCSGAEDRLIDCAKASTVTCGNGHLEDAGVRCQTGDIGTVCNYGEVRLVGGSNQYEGGVEVCINDQWGTVCDNSWGTTDATLVCKQLGYAYTSTGIPYSNAFFGSGTGPIYLDDVQCSSSSNQLLECPSSPILTNNCAHSDDAGVGCEAPCSTGDIRLAGGNIPNEGRIEICMMNNEWGTVCDDSWGSADATVVCRQLGYSTTDAVAFSAAHFGAGIGSTFLDRVSCGGGEDSLINCHRASSVICSNGHNEDAGVRCQVEATGSVCSYGDVRLVDGSNQYEGRVEVCINDQWGTVCDDSWGTADATSVCKQLGYAYTSTGIPYSNAFFGSGTGPIYLDDVQCLSSSNQLLECPSSPILTNNCAHSDDAGVGCEAPCSTGDIRLAGGNIPNEGRIEICMSNEWGTVCDDSWGSADATVVCRQLGYSTTNAVAFSAAHFGAGIGSTFLDGVSCGGNEDSLIDCTRASSVICSNGHNEDAGVRCQVEATGGVCSYGDVRLVDGSNQYEGRVEVCINDQWGTVCDDSWGTADATSVCKQLGYAYTSTGIPYSNAFFGSGTGPIYLDDVQCLSSSNQLLECPSSPILTNNCAHSDDAGVGCEAPCLTGDIRLAGGNIPNEGRIEICMSNEWGTVCDDSWGSADATVVCRQLGYSTTNAVAFSAAHFGAGIGSTFLDGVSCGGNEESLTDCTRAASVICSNGHNEDAGVRCQVEATGGVCSYGDVRLVDGSNQYEGRVEVCINDQWGTVCDDSWGTADATSVCKQLGYAYTSTGIPYSNAFFGSGTGPIYLDDVQCLSSSNQLLECPSSPILTNNCAHSDDAGVGCEAPCSTGDIRLAGGNIPNEGRIEICMSNEWGTVCDDSWGSADATVVCRQLGYSTTNAVAFSAAHFGAGIGSTFLDGVSCGGNEESLIDCTRASSVICSNGHNEDAGVRCQVEATGSVCSYGDVRLVDGSNQYEGRVEVCINDQWGTVCDDSWGTADATSVCKQLGYAYTSTGIPYGNAFFGSGTGPIFLDDVQCFSSSNQLLECPSSPILTNNCAHSDDAGVGCEAPCSTGDIRLAGGNIPNEGRIEICMSNEWGTVCDDSWSSVDAAVVCRQLGYSTTDAVAFSAAHFGAGIGSTFLDGVSCGGNEDSLIDCTRASSVICSNGHNEDAGVRCQIEAMGSVCNYGDVRLVDGSNQYEGRVEVCINDQWGTVCDDSWGTADATLVCKQLGYAYASTGTPYSNAFFGSGTGPIYMDDVQCSFSSSQLLECPSSPILTNNCDHSDDAGVGCEAPCSTGDIRLAGGNIPNEGRIEICMNNEWGTVCDDSWGSADAMVVCRQLGYSTTDAVAFSAAHFGAGIGSTFLDGVSCGGNENSLTDCTRASSVICSNGHNEDAGVRCQIEATGSVCNYGDVRLVGESNQYQGRVEVCINNQWGTVCDDSWGTADATLVCKQLGFAYTSTGIPYSNAFFGSGTGPIYLDDVQCFSSSNQLLECPSSPILTNNCDHSDDAGVGCEAPCSTGDIRLAGGNIPNEGRIEICMSNEWGTVCDDSWGSADAMVVCRQLGYSTTDAVAFSTAHFGAGIGSTFLDGVSCGGNEDSLIDCTRALSVICSNGHNEDAGVRCQIEAMGSVCNYGDVRLVDGSNQYEGRVEVCINDQWGTVCDDSWGTTDATLVCKQLGYAYASTGKPYSNAFFGSGTGPIYMDDVQCSSSSTQLLECPSSPILTNNCDHSDDAGVGCEAPCSTGDIRLAGGNIPNEGRIEICMNNEWGTVCDDSWGSADATVVCRQLGYSSIDAVAFSAAHFGAGIGSIFLDGVSCGGNENSLTDCTRALSVICSNGHNEDAGVRCQIEATGSVCSYGNIRLVDGSNQYEGRVEVCINDQWGTVCDDSWGTADATLVCKQLGYAYTSTGIPYSNALFGSGTGPIYLDDVHCFSSSNQLLECPSSPILTNNCAHSDDAGVGCEAPCSTGDIRLAGGNIPNEGRIEICMSNEWGTVCDDSWSSADAMVVCRQLGYSTTNAVAFSAAHFGAGIGSTFLDGVSCGGEENSLIDCTRAASVICSNGHNEDAGVRCQIEATGSVCSYGDVRLVDGSNQYEGRVEVCINDQWGTVCDDSWGTADATLVCKQLGYAYTSTGVPYSNAFFGSGTGQIYLDDVQCSSSSSQLLECPSSPILTNNCAHNDDAGVGCEAPCSTGDIRLAGGNIPNEGRIEICMNNEWGTVCDDSWGSADATVVCRQLGYTATDAVAFSAAHFGAGIGSTFLDGVSCGGEENSLIDCTRAASVICSNGHNEDAGVRCQIEDTGSVCSYGDIRLVDGSNQYQGRVEVCINDQWGTVCDDSWGTTDATLVCKQLGYAYTSTGTPYSNAFFGSGTGPIYMDDVQCSSSSSQLLECSSRPILDHNCDHSDDAGVGCEAPCLTGDIRLNGASVPNEGRIEICINNEWGTVCDDSWDSADVTVVCRQLGYSDSGAVAFSSAHFGAGTGSIFLDGVSCAGTESRLVDCPKNSIVICFNQHSEDAGVRCQVVDPCLSNPCDANADCIKESSLSPVFMCVCRSGFTGTGFECSIPDPCLSGPCDVNAVCHQGDPLNSEFTCTCNSPFQGDGFTCTYPDPCISNPCDVNAVCTRSSANNQDFMCECNSPFQGDGLTCIYPDPCFSDPCDANADCTRHGVTNGEFACTCRTGYTGSGFSCSVLDPCQSSPCDPNADCTRDGLLVNTFNCLCIAPFQGDGFNCTYPNPCLSDPCDVNADCTRDGVTNGEFACACRTGFTGSGLSCSVPDPCLSSPCDPNAECTRDGLLVNTFNCLCSAPYEGDGFTCTYRNPCLSNPCDVNADCTRLSLSNGDFTCICRPEYTGDGFSCSVPDPCLSSPCDPNADCARDGLLMTTFNCSCIYPYEGDGFSCIYPDPCLSNPCDVNAVCTRSSANNQDFVCECTSPFQGDGLTCIYPNPCLSDPCDVNADCTRNGVTNGEFVCICRTGFIGSGFSCSVPDPCQSSPCDPNAECTRDGLLVNTFNCLCSAPYEGDGFNCTYRNPCLSNPCDVNADCTRLSLSNGNFTCICRPEYTGDGFSCSVPDPCLSSPCDPNADCARDGLLMNMFNCSCIDPYEGDGFSCIYPDPCLSNPCDVNAVCTRSSANNQDFVCECNSPFQGDGLTCIYPDPCFSDPCDVNAECTRDGVTNGEFACTCRTGFTGSGFSCSVPDPCLSSPCDPNAECTRDGLLVNTFNCLCCAPYEGDGFSCTYRNPCLSNPCDVNADCTRLSLSNGDFTCICRPEYTGDGFSCSVPDPCLSSPCDPNADCARDGLLMTMFNCSCIYPYEGDGFSCIYPDPCLSDPCDVNAVCTRSSANNQDFVCECNSPFQEDGLTCIYPNPCLSDPCDANADCTRNSVTNGEFACTCRTGFTGSGLSCSVPDPCQSSPCDPNAECTRDGLLVNTFNCLCSAPYEGDGFSCTYRNPCLSNPCDVNADCTRLSLSNGDFTCICRPEYTGDGFSCSVPDPCLSSPCDPNADCARDGLLMTTFNCSCIYPYEGDGFSCIYPDPCLSDPCDVNAVCTRSSANNQDFVCECNSPFQEDGLTCIYPNPCLSDPCDANADCTRNSVTNGEFACTCRTGFTGSGLSCSVPDPCQSSPCDPNAECTRDGLLVNTFNCLCSAPYEGDGFSCTYRNPCLSNPCDVNADCTRLSLSNGDFTCICRPEYTGDGFSCSVPDPCLSSPCDPNADCARDGLLMTTFNCSCIYPYEGDGFSCIYPDPCLSDPCDVNAVCTRSSANNQDFVCECNSPFQGGGLTCTYPNPCLSDPCDVNADCTRNGVTNGEFVCTCRTGFTGSGFSCSVPDPCQSSPCDPNAECTRDGLLVNTFNCLCNAPYEGDGFSCTYRNPCLSSPCDINADCTRLSLSNGDFTCICRPEYTGNGFSCSVPDPCLSSPCDPNADCARDGLLMTTFNCSCIDPYEGDGFSCIYPDPCLSNPCDVNAVCTRSSANNQDFVCECNSPFQGDGLTCIYPDPCFSDPCDVNADCTRDGVTNGEFACTCRTGFTGSGFSCSVPDPCLSSPCDPNAECTRDGLLVNTFNCLCSAPYEGDGFSCTYRNPCLSNPCDVNAGCTRLSLSNGNFTCICRPEYTGDGFSCSVPDPCLSSPCDPNADCARDGLLMTTFNCSCFDPYEGDGFSCIYPNPCLSNPCDVNAVCTRSSANNQDFVCECNSPFQGDGLTCIYANPNPCLSDPCDINANCTDSVTNGEFACTCMTGFTGNGFSCSGTRIYKSCKKEPKSTETSGLVCTMLC